MSTSNVVTISDGTQLSVLANNIPKYRFNPAGIARVVLEHLRDVTSGKVDVVDATNPFVYLMESSAVCTAAAMMQNEANTRRRFASLAQTPDELYPHMSDKDYLNRFATPATAVFRLILDKQEVLDKMVTDLTTGVRSMTIPRNSEFMVNSITFSIQYPIMIKQMVHGGLEVTWDTSDESPLKPVLDTNIIEHEILTQSPSGVEVISITFDTDQFFISSYTGDINSVQGFNKKYVLKDSYYYTRVFYKNNATGGLYKEIVTTHSDQVYDAQVPTAVLKVVDGTVQVYIPQVYLTNQLVSGQIRVDIYETKGELVMNLENLKPSAFSTNWRAIDKSDVTADVAALQSMQSFFAYSTSSIASGANEVDFETLRSRVINNANGPTTVPVSPAQIQAALEVKGFKIVRNIDLLTNRVYLATRSLPSPSDPKLITAGATSIGTTLVTMDQAISHLAVRNNGKRITLTPEVLYQDVNGVISMVPDASLQAILAQDPQSIATLVTAGNYLYTPFHYVMDATTSAFDFRPYYLSSPVAPVAQFVAHNDSTLLQVNINKYNISKVPKGYRVLVEVASNDAYKAIDDSLVHAQLSFIPQGEQSRVYITGNLIATNPTSKERVFEFLINTNYDVDSNDNLWLTNLSMFNASTNSFSTKLQDDFDIFFSTSSTMPNGWVQHAIDSYIGRFLLPIQVYAITQDKLRLKFGVSLKNLWASSRSLPAASPYKTYDADVYERYSQDVYEVDPVTGTSFSVVDGQLVYKKLHSAGDIVFNGADAVVKFRRGDVMLDTSGNPIPTGANLITRQLDMMFIEGAYYFATDAAAQSYRQSIVSTLMDWIMNIVEGIKPKLLEKTKVYYYPKTTMGVIDVVIENGVTTTIEAGQSFKLSLAVPETTLNNSDLRAALEKKTIQVLDDQLSNATVTHANIVAALRTAYGADVTAFTVTGLGGDANLSMLTSINEGERCSVRKSLVAQSNGQLIVREDVTVEFVTSQQLL